MDGDRSGALLIRVWLEGGPDSFRARLTTIDTSPGASGEEATLTVAASTGDVVDAVRAWLDRFLGAAHDPIDTDG